MFNIKILVCIESKLIIFIYNDKELIVLKVILITI